MHPEQVAHPYPPASPRAFSFKLQELSSNRSLAKIKGKAQGKEISWGQSLQPQREGFKRTPCRFISPKGSSSQPPISSPPSQGCWLQYGRANQGGNVRLDSLWCCLGQPVISLWAFFLLLLLLFIFPRAMSSRPLHHPWLSACSCRPSTEEIINTVLAVIVANSTAGGRLLSPSSPGILPCPQIILTT